MKRPFDHDELPSATGIGRRIVRFGSISESAVAIVRSGLTRKQTQLRHRAMSEKCRFCCRSPLRLAANRDSILLTRILVGASHDGTPEERTGAAFLPISAR